MSKLARSHCCVDAERVLQEFFSDMRCGQFSLCVRLGPSITNDDEWGILLAHNKIKAKVIIGGLTNFTEYRMA